MRKTALPFLLMLLPTLLLPGAAQGLSAGEPFSVTNTRYGALSAESRIASNGSELFLFWSSIGSVRVTKLAERSTSVGRAVIVASKPSITEFDVVWTGERFLVAATSADSVRGQFLDSEGTPIGSDFLLVGDAHWPRLAFNGSTILFLYRSVSGTGAFSLALTPLGSRAEYGAEKVMPFGWDCAVASNGHEFAAITTGEVEGSDYNGVYVTRFDSSGRKGSRQFLPVVPADWPGHRAVAIASDGTDYHATFLEEGAGGWATIVNGGSGIPGELVPFLVGAKPLEDFPSASAVWSGSGYVVAFLQGGSSARLRTFRFDARGVPKVGWPDVPANVVRTGVSLFADSGRVLLAWNPRQESVVEELPTGGSIEGATHGAVVQKLLASASGNGSLLLVWNESLNGEESVRIGLRKADGKWSERVIASRGAMRAAAASNGDGFVVAIVESYQSTTVVPVDALGIPSSRTSSVPYMVTGLAWGGRDYALIGLRRRPSSYSEVVATNMDPAGVIWRTTVVSGGDGVIKAEAAIASDGETFFAVWRIDDPSSCSFPCVASAVRGTRLDADLWPVSETPMNIAPYQTASTPPKVAWNGREYVVVWDNNRSIWATPVSRQGAPLASAMLSVAQNRVQAPQIAVLEGGTSVVTWSDMGADTLPDLRHELVFLRPGGGITERVTLQDAASSDVRVEGVGAGRLAFATTRTWLHAPHHGSPRVTLRTFDLDASTASVAPLPPSFVTARADGAHTILRWNDPQRGPTTGFRIEYRTDDGSWVEVAEWYDAATRSASVDMSQSTTFRVRAFNDWGVSAPSPEALTEPGKRRAVR